MLTPMGIRYFARPIPPRFVATAFANPRLLFIDDDYADFLDDLDQLDRVAGRTWADGQHSLDLDKAFNDFQRLWGPPVVMSRLWPDVSEEEAVVERPAFKLVRGDVTQTARGWRAHHGVLLPDEIRVVHDDIVSTSDREIEALVSDGRCTYQADDHGSYVSDLMRCRDAMICFLSARLERGEGVLYSIG